jgi:hypothetical protein
MHPDSRPPRVGDKSVSTSASTSAFIPQGSIGTRCRWRRSKSKFDRMAGDICGTVVLRMVGIPLPETISGASFDADILVMFSRH